MEQQLIATAYDAAKSYYTINAKTKVKTPITSQAAFDAADNVGAEIFEETAVRSARNRSTVPVPRNSISKADAKALSDKNLENSLALPSSVSDLAVGTVVTGKCLGFTEKLSRRTQQLFPATKVEVNGAKFLILFDDRLEEGAEFTAIIEDAGEATRSGKTLTVK